MNRIQNILVRAPSKQYFVACGEGALAEARKQIERVAGGAHIFVLSSPRVWRNCGNKVRAALRGLRAEGVILFDDREAEKNLATVEKVCRQLIRHGADRRCVIAAVGGGVVGDVAGFVAASYLRGVKLVHVPATLVAQVDSAIGGKTGVNLPEGKNLVGAFYQPDLVIADSSLLRTLPAREYRSGIYEVIKYAVIRDARFFAFLEKSLAGLLERDSAVLSRVIAECVRAKAIITVADERESGLREILNFGHTFGHAIEAVTRYRGFLHGEAVSWGMIAATLVAIAENRLAIEPAARIIRLIQRVGDLPRLPRANAAEMIRIMRGDKKSRGGRIRFVIPTRLGYVERGIEISDALIATVWKELSRASAFGGGEVS